LLLALPKGYCWKENIKIQNALEVLGMYWEVLGSIEQYWEYPILPYHSYHIITYDRFSEWIIHLRK
jgi:hypothetical protein